MFLAILLQCIDTCNYNNYTLLLIVYYIGVIITNLFFTGHVHNTCTSVFELRVHYSLIIILVIKKFSIKIG